MEYAFLRESELQKGLFAHFNRRQTVTRCRRKIAGQWTVIDDPFVDDWSEADYDALQADLRNLLGRGGAVIGAFEGEQLKGFAAVDARPLGEDGEYLDLPYLHVSAELRGRGVGRALFACAKRWAREHGAKKLYISAHSAVESQAFYRAMGCVEAAEYSAAHVTRESCDCQLECRL